MQPRKSFTRPDNQHVSLSDNMATLLGMEHKSTTKRCSKPFMIMELFLVNYIECASNLAIHFLWTYVKKCGFSIIDTLPKGQAAYKYGADIYNVAA